LEAEQKVEAIKIEKQRGSRFSRYVGPVLLVLAILGAPFEYLPPVLSRVPLLSAGPEWRPNAKVPGAQFVNPLTIGHTLGDKSRDSLLLFVHGWPDNSRVWEQQMEALCGKPDAAHYCVALNLPGFAPGAAAPIDDGPDFDGLSERLAATTEAFIADKGSQLKVTVVGHDWGAWIVFMTEKAHPGLFDRMIAVDVGPGANARPGESEVVWALTLVIYQLLNLGCWFLGSRVPVVGPVVANVVLRSFTDVVMGFGTGAWTPTPWYERSYTQSWPYWHAWRHGDPSKCLAFTQGYQNVSGMQEVPTCPTLFLAGTVGLNLHGTEWLDAIEQKRTTDNASRALLVDGCHHWLMHQCSTEFNEHVGQFLESSDGIVAARAKEAAAVEHKLRQMKASERAAEEAAVKHTWRQEAAEKAAIAVKFAAAEKPEKAADAAKATADAAEQRVKSETLDFRAGVQARAAAADDARQERKRKRVLAAAAVTDAEYWHHREMYQKQKAQQKPK